MKRRYSERTKSPEAEKNQKKLIVKDIIYKGRSVLVD